jgi:predicted transposase YdaD
MKYIQSNELKQKIDDILVILKEIDDPEIATFIEMFSLYIENAAPKDLRKGLLEKIRENLIAGGIKMSAVTEYFREEGRRQGLEKGRTEGLEIGIKEEKEQRDIEIAMIM